ncbi:putative F-box domain-containing protein [Helianthus annuus]|uniref:F-box protein At5g07610 n=1 Tax=Helianthus annuus TaxID=4232 RepID=UPI000B8F4BA6|nr:F-box protein At5g07610 [Helianthus annuus]KAJ0646151.1 putative F-box domain-containing protein [Helianthus annuus]
MEEDSDHQPTQSGALIGSNDDLLTEILLRLPVTSILRFKSVSKHWRLHLRHTHFTHRYDKISKSPGFFTNDTIYVPYDVENPTTPRFRSLYFYPDPRGIRIVQSCNGLLLCCTYRGSIDTRKYYVFNPTTKQFAIVPCLPGGYGVRKTIRFMGLAFHRTDCVHYKLVCIRELASDDDVELFQIQIYSSDTREWRICPVTFRTDCPDFEMGVYWNGAIHWPPSYRNHLYFKIDAEQLQTLPSPVEMTIFQTLAMYFGESRGHLHLTVLVDSDETGLHLNVYEMLGDLSGWFVKYQLQLHEIWGAFPEMTRSPFDFDVVDVVRGVKEEDTFIVLRTHGTLTRYNVHGKSFKQMCDFTDQASRKYAIAHRYTESLSPF